MPALKRFVLAVCLASLFSGLFAQGANKKDREDRNTRTVNGVVTNEADNPVSGAVVQLKNTKSLQIRSFITKDDGAYHFNGLSPDVDFELKAQHEGALGGPKTLSSFDGRKAAIINLKVSK